MVKILNILIEANFTLQVIIIIYSKATYVYEVQLLTIIWELFQNHS